MTEDATVLVVDDEDKLADMYVLWLRNEYDVRTAYGAREAMNELDESVDVVLLDRRMPGVSGDRFLDELPEERSFSVVMITAVEPDFDIVEMEFDDYLCKPAKHDDLSAAIGHQLRAQDRQEPLREYLVARSKLTVLETEKSPHELSGHSAYEDLRATTERLEATLRRSIADFDDIVEDFLAIDRGA
ncbi:response regulator [Halobacteriales archaeon QS_9_68_17]|nr:MAG: response regulator [Halobacteriales archaeon QS_9_68_17]